MPHAFSRRLGESPILCDGAMGSVLYARGVSPDACFDVLNLNRPALAQLPARRAPARRGARHHRPRRRAREADDRALRAGIELAQSLVHEVRRRYAGAYLMPSFGRFEVVAEVLDAIH